MFVSDYAAPTCTVRRAAGSRNLDRYGTPRTLPGYVTPYAYLKRHAPALFAFMGDEDMYDGIRRNILDLLDVCADKGASFRMVSTSRWMRDQGEDIDTYAFPLPLVQGYFAAMLCKGRYWECDHAQA